MLSLSLLFFFFFFPFVFYLNPCRYNQLSIRAGQQKRGLHCPRKQVQNRVDISRTDVDVNLTVHVSEEKWRCRVDRNGVRDFFSYFWKPRKVCFKQFSSGSKKGSDFVKSTNLITQKVFSWFNLAWTGRFCLIFHLGVISLRSIKFWESIEVFELPQAWRDAVRPRYMLWLIYLSTVLVD